MHISATDEESSRPLQEILQNIFDSNSDFWGRAPWMPRKDEVKRVFQALANDDASEAQGTKSQDVISRSILENNTLESSGASATRALSFRGNSQDKSGHVIEKPSFMLSEPLLQVPHIKHSFTTLNRNYFRCFRCTSTGRS
jgi:hypothetical protein